MKILNDIIRKVLKSRYPKIEYFMKKPFEVQEKTLQKLLHKAENTEWGKKYGYSHIKSYQDFNQKVPISTYEDLFPYIERMMLGEQNILWGSKITWFSKSSGTTNARSKFIPVSKESLESCHFRGGRDIFALYIQNNPKTLFFRGKGLSIGGTFQKYPANPLVRCGDISAVVVQNLPQWVQRLRTPSLEVAMMEKWEEKLETMAKVTLKQDVRTILGVPTWTIPLLEKILDITGKKHIHEVWTNFEAFIHGAVAFQPYREVFQKLIPNSLYMETYNASEGFFGLQDDLSRDDMLLLLDYDIFYEFVPLSELEDDNATAIPLEAVELNKNYAMIISTNGGLWRYKIGDTVKFTSKNPYRIKITGRTKHFINAFGEEVIIENAEAAITYASQLTDAIISNYTAGPVYMGNNQQGSHEWIVEFEKQPSDFQRFIFLLDEKLKEVNSDYEAKRHKNIALKEPIVHNAPKGTFYEWLKQRGKLGGQNKVPRLANSREYLDDILQLLKMNISS
jgi:phenylacetate-coenzyme A ligase PaaK-like adenylate-forming protein